MPIAMLTYLKRLPNFVHDFHGKKAFMLSELPGDEAQWRGRAQKSTRMADRRPWESYFAQPLQTQPQSLAEIETFLQQCRYLSDLETRGIEDYWEPPDAFEQRLSGDCEDHAIWAWRQLHDLGYQARFVVGDCSNCHAWVHIFINGRVYLLETTQKHKRSPKVEKYTPWWSVERNADQQFEFYVHLNKEEIQALKRQKRFREPVMYPVGLEELTQPAVAASGG